MKRLSRWRHLPPAHKRLLLECGIALAHSAWRVRTWRFQRLAATLGTVSAPTQGAVVARASADEPAATDTARQVRWALQAWLRLLPWQPTCLMLAVAGQRLLARRGVVGEIVFGVRPGALGPGQPTLGAHAWLRHGALVVTGESEAARFQPIAVYQSPARPLRQP